MRPSSSNANCGPLYPAILLALPLPKAQHGKPSKADPDLNAQQLTEVTCQTPQQHDDEKLAHEMKHHIAEVLAAGDPASLEYIMKWSAWTVQNPGERAEAALVFRGGKGSGKGSGP